MIQCQDCEFADIGPHGEVRLRCNPFINVKEPECLQKWQLLRLDALVTAYDQTLGQYRRLAPLQERMLKFMEREMNDVDESDKWKSDWEDDEDEGRKKDNDSGSSML